MPCALYGRAIFVAMHIINRPAVRRWKHRFVASFALAGGLAAPALAQQAPTTIRLHPEDAERGMHGPQHNFDFLAPGVMGENYQSAGFFGQRIRPYLAGNAEALAHLDQYRRQKTLFLLDKLVSVGSFGLYGQQILSGGDYQYFNPTQRVALGVFAASILATVFINTNTNTYMQRAVNAYNAGLAHSSPWQQLRPSSVGFGAAPTGQPQLVLRWAVR